jgi:hypothetical protein
MSNHDLLLTVGSGPVAGLAGVLTSAGPEICHLFMRRASLIAVITESCRDASRSALATFRPMHACIWFSESPCLETDKGLGLLDNKRGPSAGTRHWPSGHAMHKRELLIRSAYSSVRSTTEVVYETRVSYSELLTVHQYERRSRLHFHQHIGSVGNER